jgi:glycosyltransferase involved in cell wall biosynthesis
MLNAVKPGMGRARSVYIVAPVCPPYGGMSVQAERLTKCLKREGIPTSIVATNPDPPTWLQRIGNPPVLRTLARTMQYRNSLKRIDQHSVIHHFSASHLYFFIHSLPLLLLPKDRRRKLIINYRGGEAVGFLARWAWFVVPLMRRADLIAVPSEFLKSIFSKYGLNSVVLPNLAETEEFRFVERKPFTPKLLVTRNLEPIYDVECVLRAFRILQQRMPEATLGVVGDGSESQRLRELAEQWNLRAVTFYGALPPTRLPDLYAQHDMYVNSSRVDNFPGSLVEAACSGLPIVTTKAGGIHHMIQDGRNGLLVDIGDHRAIANGIVQLLKEQNFARQMAIRARQWAEQFSWESIFPQLSACYGFDSPARSPECELQAAAPR